jgi:hypothetical protein
MGVLRRPTPGEKEEDGRFSRPYGPDALSRAIREISLNSTHYSKRTIRRAARAKNPINTSPATRKEIAADN